MLPQSYMSQGLADTHIAAQVFSEVFQREFQFINSDARKGTCLACALLMRGNIGISDATRNLERIQQYLPLAQWNPQAFKLGLCSVPAAGAAAIQHDYSSMITSLIQPLFFCSMFRRPLN
jgi:hypothetical protein